jgi:hypothetical protein
MAERPDGRPIPERGRIESDVYTTPVAHGWDVRVRIWLLQRQHSDGSAMTEEEAVQFAWADLGFLLKTKGYNLLEMLQHGLPDFEDLTDEEPE